MGLNRIGPEIIDLNKMMGRDEINLDGMNLDKTDRVWWNRTGECSVRKKQSRELQTKKS